MVKSYAPEVIADSSGEWCGNALRFRTREEAEANVRDLACRWVLVRETRVVESDDEPNYNWDPDKGLVPIEKVDVRVIRDVPNPTVYLFQPLTDKAKQWFEENIASVQSRLGEALVVEHRYAQELAEGLKSSGLVVV